MANYGMYILTAMNFMTPSNAVICAASYHWKDSTKKSASAVFAFVSARRANMMNKRKSKWRIWVKSSFLIPISKSKMILRRQGGGDEAYCTYVEEADDAANKDSALI